MNDALRQEAELVRKIGIAEGGVARAPMRLRTSGLGSCVGVVLYDATAAVAGLVHVMLPTSPVGATNVTKYADVGVPWLFEQVMKIGGKRDFIRAKIAGGAQMFASAGQSDILRVGPRNVEAVNHALNQLGVPVVAADVGGNVGRTIEFDIATGRLSVRTAMRGTYYI
ncbi:chemoreceptor glutamine deamidase CheD [Alicyclobacillus contaminans]|uniref:chemotaxis protein CheD n=1 Tax=Alicyclobacillus contaminans TaxID=392016 RepID=UPI0003F8BCB3|nr:chemotaxis protein CheD [Alicyclobacillus contaminans]GMA49015.1 chemoreceptor glutamine deamidase CheD [Alicyclobacillus contaminans]